MNLNIEIEKLDILTEISSDAIVSWDASRCVSNDYFFVFVLELH